MNRLGNVTAGLLAGVALTMGLLAAGPALAQGKITVSMPLDLRETTNLNARQTWDKAMLNSTVFDALFETDQEGRPTPSLAESATPSADLLEWRIVLRPGVKFHSGRELVAQDIADNFAAFLDPAQSNMANDLSNIESVTVASEREVVVRLKTADAQLPAVFTNNFMIGDLQTSTAQKPVGTGPYMWGERVPGDYVEFVRFDDHWRGRPPLDTVELRVIPEEDVAALELQAGNVDIIFNSVSVEALPQLRANPDMTIHQAAGNTFVFATTNFEKDRRGGYKDAAAVRQGLAYFWNAEQRIPPIVGDFGEVANQVIPPWQPGHDPNIEQYPYDPERGRELLEQGGIPPGGTLSFLALSTVPFQCDIATSFASDMTQQGYKVNLECLPGQTALPIVQQYEWDLLFPRTSGRATAAAMYAERYALSLAVPAPEDQWTLADEELIAIVDRMRAASSQEEYVALGQEAARHLHDTYYQLPAYWENFLVATGPRVQGFVSSPLGWYGFLMNNMTRVTVAQ